MQRLYAPDMVVADVQHGDRAAVQMKISDVQSAEKLEKFVEDVKSGPPSRFRSRSVVSLFFCVLAGTESTP